jgi:hypothetical protein
MSRNFSVDNTPVNFEAQLFTQGFVYPRYVQGVVTPRAIGNYPVQGPNGNLVIPTSALITKITLSGASLVGVGAIFQSNLTPTAGAAMGASVIGPTHSIITVGTRVCNILATPIQSVAVTYSGDEFLNVNLTGAAVTTGSINVLIEYM